MSSASSSISIFLSLKLRSNLSLSHKDQNLLSLLSKSSSSSRFPLLLRVSRKNPSYSKESVLVLPDPRVWVGDLGDVGDINEDDDDEDEEEDRSLDLLVQFLQNMFRKISREARRAVRSVLPPSISTKLVGFTVNGVLMLAFLWILKAFLEVVCMVGSMVFVSILLIRGIWSAMSYIKDNQFNYMYRVNRFNNKNTSNNAWNGVQPVV